MANTDTVPATTNKPAPKVVYINYTDAIDIVRVKNTMAIITGLLANENPDVLYFLFSSSGGEVDAGVALYNFLKALPIKIVMHNIGVIDSIANVVFVAGEKRYAVPHSTFLFHGVMWGLTGPSNLSLQNIKEILSQVNQKHDTIAGIICQNTSMQEKTIKKLFAQGETKDVNFALEKGIIHKVELAKIPHGSLLVSININT